jgi:hypothetical protein
MADVKCPTCKKVMVGGAPSRFRPFCSERCRSIDLGGWLDGAYRISAPVTEEDLDEGLPEGAPSSKDEPAN